MDQSLIQACQKFSSGILNNCLSHIAQDVSWTIIGDDEIIGKQSLVEFNQQTSAQVFPRYVINNLIVHEDYVVIEGSDSDQSDYYFCDVFYIENEQITKITSYVV